MDEINLTKKEFDHIHSGMCSLYQVARQLEDVLNESLLEELRSGIAEIEKGIKRTRKQESDSLDVSMDYWDQIRKDLGATAIWSMYDIKDAHDQHPYQEYEIITYEGASAFIRGSTWVDIYAAANQCIERSGDHLHIFIEGFRKRSGELELITGS